MIGIVTATTNLERADAALQSWHAHAAQEHVPMRVVQNGGERPYLGSVSAFRQGVDDLLEACPEVDIIACLHDDLTILDDGWDAQVEQAFRRHPGVGLVGFGGAIGLGADTLYQTPYDPMQLARIGFRSNLVDAEAHGTRSTRAEPVVCLDGFSQIGRRAFWMGEVANPQENVLLGSGPGPRPWFALEDLGVRHHFYDGALGCLARRAGWDVRYVPVRCRHDGGRTAVGDPGYQAWARTQHPEGDQGFWREAHRVGYEAFRDVLPLRLGGGR